MLNFKEVYVNESDWALSGRLIRKLPTKNELAINYVARIKVGEKVHGNNGNTWAKGLDYFKVHENEAVAHTFENVYGAEPSYIRIMFLRSDIHACRELLELRNSEGKVAAETDNQNIRVVRKDPNNPDRLALLPMNPEEIEKRGGVEAVKETLKNHFESKKGWVHKLRLSFCLYDLMEGMGQFFFETGGTHSSIPNILSTFDAVKAIMGRVDRIPFTLRVRIAKGALAGSTNRYPVVSLSCDLIEPQLYWLKDQVENHGFPYENQGVLSPNKIKEIYKQMKEKTKAEEQPDK